MSTAAQVYDPVTQTFKDFVPVAPVVNNSGGVQPDAPRDANGNPSMAGQPGYDVFGNKVAGTPNATGGSVASNTPASVYAGLGDSATLIAARQQQINAAQADANSVVDPATIRAQTLASFQAEIDAQNAIFADKLNAAKVEGAGRLGSSTAIQARRGELGSDFGSAQTDTVNAGNDQVYSSINDEKAAAIAAIMDKANTQANADIATKTAAKKAGLDSYVQYLNDGATRATTNATTAAQLLVTKKVSPDDLAQTDLDALTSSYGISADQLKSAYATAKSAQDAADAKTKQDNDKAAADLALTKANTGKVATDAKAASDKFEEDKREFGLNYALKQQENAIAQQNANANTAKATGTAGTAADAVQDKKDIATKALTLISQLRDTLTKSKGALVGPVVGSLPNISSAAVDFDAQQKQLVYLLSLNSASLLKGQGSVSEGERDLLQGATTQLSTKLSPDAYAKELDALEATLSKVATAPALGADEQAEISSYYQ